LESSKEADLPENLNRLQIEGQSAETVDQAIELLKEGGSNEAAQVNIKPKILMILILSKMKKCCNSLFFIGSTPREAPESGIFGIRGSTHSNIEGRTSYISSFSIETIGKERMAEIAR
jgi:hypothetical protein